MLTFLQLLQRKYCRILISTKWLLVGGVNRQTSDPARKSSYEGFLHFLVYKTMED